jgi:hypothetical protein
VLALLDCLQPFQAPLVARQSSDPWPALLQAKNTLDDRRVELAETLRALNSQFCE